MAKLFLLTVVLFAFLLVVQTANVNNLWIDIALKFQRELAKDVQIHEISFPCAHNAYNNPKNLPPLLMQYENLELFKDRVILENQELTMTQLLEIGVRHLSIDAHFINKYNETWLCHGSDEATKLCPLIEAGTGVSCEEAVNLEDLGPHTGCSTDAASWDEGIAEIATWYYNHTDEFLWIDIEDQVSFEANAIESQFTGPIIDRLGSYIFKNSDLATFRAQNPSYTWPTISQLRSLGKTVIVTGVNSRFASIVDYNLAINPNIGYPDNNAIHFDKLTCNNLTPNWTLFGESDLKVFIDFLGFDINEDGHTSVGDLSPNNLKEVVNCGFAGCADRIGNAEMASAIWSWESPYTQIACQPSLCPVLQDGTWSHVDCNGVHDFACQSNTDPNSWQVTGASSFSSASSACSPGFTASYPKTAYQNRLLKTIAGSSTIWLNFQLTLNSSHPVCSSGYESPASHASLSPLLFLFSPFLLAFFAFSAFL